MTTNRLASIRIGKKMALVLAAGILQLLCAGGLALWSADSAGKGFAVVANEIKPLAQQTASATEDIEKRIVGVQSSTTSGIAGIEKVSQVIHQVNDIVSSIAAAIEEQATVTKDIARNIATASAEVGDANARISQTSQVSKEIAGDIAHVDEAAAQMAGGSPEVQTTVVELSKLAEHLQETVTRFRAGSAIRIQEQAKK